MAVCRYIIFVCFLFYGVVCDLNLDENEPCVTEGVNGTCVGIYRCKIASLTYDFANAGFIMHRSFSYPELPDICSYKNNDPVVCCTDCKIYEKPFDSLALRPHAIKERQPVIHQTVAYQKCLEYFKRLPYPCRGVGAFQIEKVWDEDMKCHNYTSSIALASGGRDAQRWEFPHVALLGYGNDVDSAQWLCGGSVISERFILTAAHCTSTSKLGNIKFAALGLLKRTDPKKYWKIYNIKRIIIHPEYKSPSKYHDIALLETETEINFGKDLLPACLNTIIPNSQYRELAEASGWGRLGKNKELADTLQVVYLDEFTETECSTLYRPHRHLINGYDHEKQMCFGSLHDVADTCDGDSGGPLQTNEYKCLYKIEGVTSYGIDCGIPGSAGMYTRVSYYVPWIEGIVWPEETKLKKEAYHQWFINLLS